MTQLPPRPSTEDGARSQAPLASPPTTSLPHAWRPARRGRLGLQRPRRPGGWRPSGVPETFAALRYRDFRLLTFGTGFAIASYWMILIAQGWLVLELTDSAFWVAAASSALAIPSLIFGPLAGVVADRLYRKTLLLTTRSIVAALSVIEGVLILVEVIDIWQILVFGFLIGTAYAMDIPARQSLIPDTVPPEVVPNGIAINVSIFSIAAISGPLAGAATLATVGAGGCFIANAAGNLALVLAIALMKIPRRRRTGKLDVLGDFVGGLRYVRSSPVALLLLLISLLTMIGTAPWRELAPVFVRDVFAADEAALGALFTGSGVGSVIGAAILLSLARVQRRALAIAVATALAIASVAGFALSPTLPVAVGFAVLSGVANQLSSAIAQTVLLLRTPEEFRGRVMSLWMLLWGVQPIGTLIVGTLAEVFSPRLAVLGMALGVAALIALLSLRMRHTWNDF